MIAKRTTVDVSIALVAICTIALLWKFKKLQEPVALKALVWERCKLDSACVVGPIMYFDGRVHDFFVNT